MACVILSSSLGRYASGSKFNHSGETLGDVLAILCKINRNLSQYIFLNPTELHPFINIFIDNRNAKDLLGLNTPLEENSVIRILPGISGG